MRVEQGTQLHFDFPPSQNFIKHEVEKRRGIARGYRDLAITFNAGIAGGSFLAKEPSFYIKYLPISGIVTLLAGAMYLVQTIRARRLENTLNQQPA